MVHSQIFITKYREIREINIKLFYRKLKIN